MHKLWIILGRCVFWISLPLLHVYLKSSKRTRILLVSGDKILVVKGWMNDGNWSLPGGGLHRKEQPQKGVIRELLEETGIDIQEKDLTNLGVASQNQRWLNFKYHRFVAEVEKPLTPKPRRPEIVETVWLPIDQVNTSNAQAHLLETLAAWRVRH